MINNFSFEDMVSFDYNSPLDVSEHFGTFNFYLIKISKINKIVKAKKNVHLSKGLPGGEDSPRKEACGGPGSIGHVQDGPRGVPGGGGGPEGLAGDGAYHLSG